MLFAVHRQQAGRAATLGGSLRSANREEAGVKSLGVRQNLLVVFRAEKKDDALAAFFDRGDRTVKLVKPPEVAQQVARELGEVDPANRQSADCVRSVSREPCGSLGRQRRPSKPSKQTFAGFAEVAARPIHGMPATLAKTAALKRP